MLGLLFPRLLPATSQVFPLPHDLPLTPYEQILHEYQQTYPAAGVFTIVVRVRGRIDIETLRRAVEALQRRHPFLRASVHRDHRRLSYHVADKPPAVRIDSIETSDPDLWRTEAVNRSREPFPEDRAPFLRLAVLQSAEGAWTDLLLTMNHLVADGRSVQSMLGDLQSAWAAAKVGAAELPPQAWVPPVLPEIPFRLWSHVQALMLHWRTRLQVGRRMKFVKRDATALSIRRDVLTTEDTHRLRRRCREEDASLYGALSAAMTQSLATDPRHAGRTVRIVSPVDFRNLCEPRISPEQVGCYAWILKYDLEAPDRRAFWALARESRKKLDAERMSGAIQQSWHGLKWVLPFYRPRRVEARNRRREPGLVSVNDLGTIRNQSGGSELVIEEFGWHTNRDFSVPTIALNVALVEGRLNLTLSSPCHTPDELEQLAAEVRRRLTSA